MWIVAFIFLVAIIGKLLIGLAFGDDGDDYWQQPLGFAAIFAVIFPILYWRMKRDEDG